MRICYLPIFFALLTTLFIHGTSGQGSRVARQLNFPILDLLQGLLSSVISMVLPIEVTSALGDTTKAIFTANPLLDLSALTPLTDGLLGSLGRRRRAVHPKTSQRELQSESEHSKKPEDGVVGSTNLMNFFPLTMDFAHNTVTARPTRHRMSKKNRRIRSSDDDDLAGDPQVQAGNTMLAGSEMLKKGVTSGQSGVKAGADLAESVKQGAETAGIGAEMMEGGAKTIMTGMEQGKSQIPGK